MTMPVPGSSSLFADTPSIADQVAGETEEQRKKRLAGMQASKQLPVGASAIADGYGSALGVS